MVSADSTNYAISQHEIARHFNPGHKLHNYFNDMFIMDA